MPTDLLEVRPSRSEGHFIKALGPGLLLAAVTIVTAGVAKTAWCVISVDSEAKEST